MIISKAKNLKQIYGFFSIIACVCIISSLFLYITFNANAFLKDSNPQSQFDTEVPQPTPTATVTVEPDVTKASPTQKPKSNSLANTEMPPIPTSIPSENPPQDYEVFLNQVAGINLTDYNITHFKRTISQVLGSQKNHTFISLTLNNNQRSLQIAIELTEGKVSFYDLSLLSGSFESQLTTIQLLDNSRKAINSYMNNFNASYCSEFANIVPSFPQAQNVTVTNENITLKIVCKPNSVIRYMSFDWCPTIDADKPFCSVQLSLTNAGIISSFSDKLGLFTIATRTVTVSEEQAINIAMPFINKYAQENNRTVQTVTASFAYIRDLGGSRGDSYLIYPQWSIEAALEGLDINWIFGYSVLIWADNGQVHSKSAQGIM